MTDLIDSPAFQLVAEVVHEHGDFRRKLRRISGKGGSVVKTYNTKAGLEQQSMELEQNNLSFDSWKQQASTEVANAANAHAIYENQRVTGRRKFGRSISRFIKGFADFLSVYSGIVELVKDAGQVYGSVAYETLSIFLVVGLFSYLDEIGKNAEKIRLL